jgi:hypothetical protein
MDPATELGGGFANWCGIAPCAGPGDGSRLWAALVAAAEKVGHLPSRLRVYDEASEAMFRAAGFDVERPAEMSAFEQLRAGMCEMMGDVALDESPF